VLMPHPWGGTLGTELIGSGMLRCYGMLSPMLGYILFCISKDLCMGLCEFYL